MQSGSLKAVDLSRHKWPTLTNPTRQTRLVRLPRLPEDRLRALSHEAAFLPDEGSSEVCCRLFLVAVKVEGCNARDAERSGVQAPSGGASNARNADAVQVLKMLRFQLLSSLRSSPVPLWSFCDRRLDKRRHCAANELETLAPSAVARIGHATIPTVVPRS